MSKYEEGLKIIDERCGNGKDNVISLATISLDTSADGKPRPSVRDVDAYYEDGVFYIVTYAKSKKMMQIEKNNEVAFALSQGWFSGNGIGENLGWVLDPKNTSIREKLRKVFAEWYDFANNEDDQNCVILAIHITKAIVIKDHHAKTYYMDFINKLEETEEKEK